MKIRMKAIWMLGLAIGLLTSCKEANHRNEQKMVVNVVKATGTTTHQTNKEFSFIAKPFRTSELSFRVGGPIDRLEVYAGNYYQRANIIAEIDSRDFRIRKERAEAVYNQVRAEYERIQVLYEKENLSASAYEKAKSDYISAKMAYETAVNELADTQLLAPFNGYVGEVYVEKFQDVKATQPVLSLIDIDQLKIEVYITQDIALTAQDLTTVHLTFDALPGERFEARVVEISKGTTRNNLSYMLTALLPNAEKKLLAGMSGKVSFEVASPAPSQGVVVPEKALCHRPAEGDYVWVIDTGGNVACRKIATNGLLPGGKVAVTSGLNEGEQVAVSGLRFLSDGMTVECKE